MSLTPFNIQHLFKRAAVDNYIKYLDNIAQGDYSFRAEEVELLAGLDKDGIAGLSDAEIDNLKTKLTDYRNNIELYLNEDGSSKANFDLDGNGSTANDLTALQHILSSRTEANPSATLMTTTALAAATSGILNPVTYAPLSAPGGLAGITTRGGYTIITDVNDTRPESLGTNHNIIIKGPDGQVMSHIWGDPHVVENGGANVFHFGDDSTFILPDGTKIFMNTVPWQGQEGALVARGLVIDDGQRLFTTGTVTAGGRDISNTSMVEIPRTSADYAVLNNAALADQTSAVHSGVFAWSEAANNGLGGWAKQTSAGIFRDVKNEHFYTYLQNLGYNDQLETGTVSVSREATLASLDGIAAAGLARIGDFARSPIGDAYLELALHAGTQHNIDNFVTMLQRSASLETFETYTKAAMGLLPATIKTNFDNLIANGQTHHVINGYASLVNANANEQTISQYLAIANNNSLSQTHKDTLLRGYTDVALKKPSALQDLLDLGLDPNSHSGIEAFHFAFFVTHYDPRPDAQAAFKAIRTAGMRTNTDLDTMNRVVSAYMAYNANHNDGDFDGANQVLAEFANNPNTTMSHLETIIGYMNADRPATAINTYAKLAHNISEFALEQYLNLVASGANDQVLNTFMSIASDVSIPAGARDSLLKGYAMLAPTAPEAIPGLMELAKVPNPEGLNVIDSYAGYISQTRPSMATITAIRSILTAGLEQNDFTSMSKVLNNYLNYELNHRNATGEDVTNSLTNIIESGAGFANADKLLSYASAHKSAAVINAYAHLVTTGSHQVADDLIAVGATASMLASFDRLVNSNATDAQIQGFINIFDKQPCDNSVKEAWLKDYSHYSIAGDTNRVALLNTFINLGFNQYVTRPFLSNDANVSRGAQLLGLPNANEKLQGLLLLSDIGLSSAVQDRYVELARNGASTTMLRSFATVHARKNPTEITALNTYISLNASDAFMDTFMQMLSGLPSTSPNRPIVGFTNSLIALGERESSRNFTTDMSPGTLFAKHTSREIISIAARLTSVIASLANPSESSATHLKTPAVMERALAELAKLNDPNTSDKDKLIAAKLIEHIAANGLTNVNAALTTITNSVVATMRTYGLVPNPGPNPGPGPNPNPNPGPTPVNRTTNRLIARLSGYVNSRQNYQNILANLTPNDRRYSQLEARIAALDSRIAALEAQLGNNVTA